MKIMRRSGPACAALLTAGLLTADARPARADEGDVVAALAVVAVGLFIADVTFAVNDIVLGAKGELPSDGYAVAETIVAAPQALAFNPILMVLAEDIKDEPLSPLLMIPTAGVTALTTHGLWTLTDDGVDPGVLPAVSSAIGANATLTLNALAAAADGELVGRPMGIAQVILTAPSLAGGTYGAIRNPERRAEWIALSAWSGALFLHGVASAIWDAAPDSPPPSSPSEPPSPPEPPPDQREKPPLLVPASIQFSPGVVTDGVATVPGILAGGRF
jgi:hypothetical protein